MKQVYVVLMVLAVAVLVGGLTGCRSGAKRAQTPAASGTAGPMVQAPAPYVGSQPSVSSQPPTYSQPYSPTQGQVVSRRVISRTPAPTGISGQGSPDGPVSGDYPTAFSNLPPAGADMNGSPVGDITAAADSGANLDVEIERLRQRLSDVRGELAQVKNPVVESFESPEAGAGDIAARFAEDLRSRTGSEVVLSGSTVVIRVSDAFESGSNQLKKDASLLSTLQATADALTSAPAASVEVVGHSDVTPLKRTKTKWGTNKVLSEARAQTVATELSRHGVPASRMEVRGMGSAQLLDNATNKRAHAKNRRVEVVVRF